jgi:polyisoprenoid-binding protein YceI
MKWQIDPTHTSVTFQIRHMGVFFVTGSFHALSGGVLTNADYIPERIQLEIDIKSIQTGNSARDAHLLSPEFFDVEKNPKIQFQSNSVSQKAERFSLANLFNTKKSIVYVASGQLAMRGVVQPVELEFEIPSAPFEDPWQAKRIGAKGSAQLDRTRWGINWNQDVPTAGAVLVGNEVKIAFNTQMTLVK